jgi:hypothetical protein
MHFLVVLLYCIAVIAGICAAGYLMNLSVIRRLDKIYKLLESSDFTKKYRDGIRSGRRIPQQRKNYLHIWEMQDGLLQDTCAEAAE